MTFIPTQPPGARPGDYPTLGFDPAPGEPAVVDAASQKIAEVARDLDRAREDLESIGEVGGIWEGVAAEAFVEAMEDLPEKTQEVSDGLYRASGLLSDWEGSLGDYQRQAMDLEHQAAAAKRELDQARSDPALDLAGQYFPDEESLREAQARYEAALQDVRMWEDRLRDIIAQAWRLLGTHQDEAHRIAEQLNEILELEGGGGLVGGLVDAVGGLVSGAFDLVSGFVGDVADFVKEHAAEIAKNIGDAFSALSTALGALSLAVGAVGLIIPPLAPVAVPVAGLLLGGAAGASAVAVGAHGAAKLAGADVEWSTIRTDALGALPGGALGKIRRDLAEAGDADGLFDLEAYQRGLGEVIDDLETYWVPDDLGELALVPTGGLVVWNAFEEAMNE
ncbi:MAG: hypothetical protein GEV03_00235 [Streptosporangiales bacterium]|nr:hypothetical protein [Streptosporangiales bacterium]